MMHLVTCLGEKKQVSFQGDDDPPQKTTTQKKNKWGKSLKSY